MNFSKKDVMNFVRECLGDDPEGVFVDSEVSSGDIEPEDSDIYTNILREDVLEYDFKDCRIDMGVTKLVIVPRERNYVIKIPFTGTYCYDDEINELVINSIIKSKNSIMKEEEEIFDAATGFMKEILLENHFVGFFNDCIPVYVQRKAIPNSCYDTGSICCKLNKNIKYRIASYLKDIYNSDLNIVFILRLLLNYGINNTINLINEISYIDDLHNGNYGYDVKGGRPVIIDYGGYDISMWDSD